jgi:hypothetical protein
MKLIMKNINSAHSQRASAQRPGSRTSSWRHFADASREENAWPAVGNSQQSGPIVHKHTVYQCGYENPEEAEDKSLAEVDEMNVSRMKEADRADENLSCIHHWLVVHNGG